MARFRSLRTSPRHAASQAAPPTGARGERLHAGTSLRSRPTSGNPRFAAHDELTAYAAGGRAPSIDADAAEIAVPLRLRHGDHEPTFISTVTTFGTAVDITVSELSIASLFPADAATAELLRAAGAAQA